jgi:hypothetical protein
VSGDAGGPGRVVLEPALVIRDSVR